MYKAREILHLVKEAFVPTDTDAQLGGGANNFDLTGFVPGSFVTIDITQDDPKSYEVVLVDGDYVVVKDPDSDKVYRLPLSRVALQELESPYTSAELDAYQVGGGVESSDNSKDSEQSKSEPKTNNDYNQVDSAEMKKSGLSVSVVKSFANKFLSNQNK